MKFHVHALNNEMLPWALLNFSQTTQQQCPEPPRFKHICLSCQVVESSLKIPTSESLDEAEKGVQALRLFSRLFRWNGMERNEDPLDPESSWQCCLHVFLFFVLPYAFVFAPVYFAVLSLVCSLNVCTCSTLAFYYVYLNHVGLFYSYCDASSFTYISLYHVFQLASFHIWCLLDIAHEISKYVADCLCIDPCCGQRSR